VVTAVGCLYSSYSISITGVAVFSDIWLTS
jgi:hypothetical protein